MPEDLPVVATYRMPAPGRQGRGPGSALEEVSTAVTLRAVPADAMEPLAVEGFGFGRRYASHAGRAWLALCPRIPGTIIRWSRPADMGEALGILSRPGFELMAHGLHPSPFAHMAMGMRASAVLGGYPGGAEALRGPAEERVGEIFDRDMVTDGRHVYMATRAPAIVLRRGRNGHWTYRVGPAAPFDPRHDEITFCVRQADRFAKGLKALDPGLARAALRDARRLAAGFAHLDPDDGDLAELANAASVGAIWLKGRLRRAPDPATPVGEDFANRLATVRRRAALGMVGAIPGIERTAAIEDAVRLVADLAAANPRARVAPEMAAFLSYAELVAIPRIAEAATAPEDDLDGLRALAR